MIAVFSDLDGTLLDHETYDWSPARPVLDRLRAGGHALILASSKTAAEIAPLRAQMGFAQCPAIVENGAGLLPAEADAVTQTRSHPQLLAILRRVRAETRAPFRGFSDWSVAEIAARTGLSAEAAEAAARRDFSEPGLFGGPPSAEADFVTALNRAGVSATRGGRFLTLSFGADKGARLREIARALQASATVALGDAPNDMGLLETADHGIVIPNPAHAGLPTLPGEEGPAAHITRAAQPGPAGWATALGALLDRLGAA